MSPTGHLLRGADWPGMTTQEAGMGSEGAEGGVYKKFAVFCMEMRCMM